MPWVFDGSNVGGVLGGARGARDRATVWQKVFAWARGRRRVVLVFDGAAEPGIPDRLGTVEVRWALAQSADEVVRRLVARRPREWHVVTNDRALREACRDLGASVLGVRDWLGTLEMTPANATEDNEKADVPVDVAEWERWFEREGED